MHRNKVFDFNNLTTPKRNGRAAAHLGNVLFALSRAGVALRTAFGHRLGLRGANGAPPASVRAILADLRMRLADAVAPAA
jgi:hypothetical protein